MPLRFRGESQPGHPVSNKVRAVVDGPRRTDSEARAESATRQVRVGDLAVGNIIQYQGDLYRVNVPYDREIKKLGVRPVEGGRDVDTYIFGNYTEISLNSVDTVVTVKE